MKGHLSPILPPDLWGPEICIKNSIGAVHKEYDQFAVTDIKEGRLKRTINYEGEIAMPMTLHEFPFDVQSLTVDMLSISHVTHLL